MYSSKSIEQQNILKALNGKAVVISWSRIVLFLTAIYLFYLMLYRKNEAMGWWALVVIIVFVIAVNMYLKLQAKIKYHKTLQQINEDEIAFLNGKKTFENGSAFLNPQHAFSYDLDLFGNNSIFQFINRTGTSLGRKQLANDLQIIPQNNDIIARQEAVKELTDNLEFRQEFQALSLLAATTEAEDVAIERWTKSPIEKPHKILQIGAVVVPTLFFISLLALALDWHPVAAKLTMFFFSFNLLLVGLMTRYIMQEIGKSDKIAYSLQQYSKMIQLFEKASFQSNYLKNKQNELKTNQIPATKAVNELANLFEKLNTLANLFIFIAFNGTFQYHFWVHKKLLLWKQTHQHHLWQWIKVIGEVESLNSLANFAYNNKEYQYATVSDNEISFENLGHPLLSKEKRVRNSIDFTNQSFVILTGSNMSGKSTFLRTVGINLVLSYAGAPIDASKAVVTALPLWVSMRLTDSLSDSESFFFAEVKRLKEVVTEAEKQPIFVLLDEILKGTNSDDKKTGTVGVIEKLHNFQVKGMIATHDLEVCETTNRYPETMTNKRFEVEIVNNELCFDYQLKEGVCQNKNATFIMKKMEII